MRVTRSESPFVEKAAEDRGGGWLAAGGALGAVLASTCCIGPLALFALGVSGAWIANLTALEPYKPVFAAAALPCIGLGFRAVRRARGRDCGSGAYCARPGSAIVVRSALWVSAALVIVALTVDWWAPLLY